MEKSTIKLEEKSGTNFYAQETLEIFDEVGWNFFKKYDPKRNKRISKLEKELRIPLDMIKSETAKIKYLWGGAYLGISSLIGYAWDSVALGLVTLFAMPAVTAMIYKSPNFSLNFTHYTLEV